MSATDIRAELHGTHTGYIYGCRCDDCRGARSAAAGHRSQSECVQPIGKTSRCSQIAMRLVDTQANLGRIARLANRSAKSFATHAAALAEAKAERAKVLALRDQHMTECPGALDRFTT